LSVRESSIKTKGRAGNGSAFAFGSLSYHCFLTVIVNLEPNPEQWVGVLFKKENQYSVEDNWGHPLKGTCQEKIPPYPKNCVFCRMTC
jgi:hypothetical protein